MSNWNSDIGRCWGRAADNGCNGVFQQIADRLTSIRTRIDGDNKELKANMMELRQTLTDEFGRVVDSRFSSEMESQNAVIEEIKHENLELKNKLNNQSKALMEITGSVLLLRSIVSQMYESRTNTTPQSEIWKNWDEFSFWKTLNSLEVIGTGQFGKVYKFNTNEGEFALKVCTYDEEEAEMFAHNSAQLVNEVSILQRLEPSPNNYTVQIVAALRGVIPDELGKLMKRRDTEAIGMLMKYEPLKSLEALLFPKRSDPNTYSTFTLEKKILLALKIAKAIDFLHRNGIIHGDLKPANILLSGSANNPDVKLADFGFSVYRAGIARRSSRSTIIRTNNNSYAGTFLFSAPEMLISENQRERAAASRATDIYAMALIFYEIFSGKRAYEGMILNSDEESSVAQVVLADNRPEMDIGLPVKVISLIQHCWARDRSARLSAASCVTTLESALMSISSRKHDIFVSHAWDDTRIHPFVQEVATQLSDHNFKIWIDVMSMGHDLTNGIENGIQSSKVVLAFINRKYQNSVYCMHELKMAKELNIPVVAISMESNPYGWATPELKELLRLGSKLYLDASRLRQLPWGVEDPYLHVPTPLMEKDLNVFLVQLQRLLEENNCIPE